MGKRVHTDTHIYPVGICVMACRGISEMGTWKPCKHTTGILVGSTIHREGLSLFSICNISIEISVAHMNIKNFMRITVHTDTHSSLLLLSNNYCYT